MKENSVHFRYLETLNDHNDVYIQNHHIQPPMEYTLGICLKYVKKKKREKAFLKNPTLIHQCLHNQELFFLWKVT